MIVFQRVYHFNSTDMESNVDRQIFQLYLEGQTLEELCEFEEARRKFEQAWSLSQTDFEKSLSARFLAAHQNTSLIQLEWLTLSLNIVLKSSNQMLKTSLPLLYHEIGQCLEDLMEYANAKANYLMGQGHLDYLPNGGEGAWEIEALKECIERMDQMGY